MADPRFYDNRGPVTLGALCVDLGVPVPEGADPSAAIADLAGIAQAGPLHLSFFEAAGGTADLARTRAGFCLLRADGPAAPAGTLAIRCERPAAAFAGAARLFYAADECAIGEQPYPVAPTARLGEGVLLAPGVVIGPGAEIGARTRIGAHAVIGHGVTIGRDSEIGPGAWIGFAHLGDEVVVGSGARIGGPGFGFASSPAGHLKMPQLGRVIVQDCVEIGANSTIDRGALADTTVGEGTKIDNLVQIGHNNRIGRHCILVSQVGLSGSVVLGDFVVLGGKVGVADHVVIGDGARVTARAGVTKSLPGGRDYGGFPARPIKEWHREVVTLARLSKTRMPKNPKRTKI